MIAVDKAAPLAVSRKPRRFQDGVSSGRGEIGVTSAMGLPCRSTNRFSPPSTAESSPDAFLRNSVNVTVFMSASPIQSVHYYTLFCTVCKESFLAKPGIIHPADTSTLWPYRSDPGNGESSASLKGCAPLFLLQADDFGPNMINYFFVFNFVFNTEYD
jgi:hypothetical protein